MTQLMQAAPGSVWLHYATAEVHASLQRYDLAIVEYRNVLEMEPRMPGIHFRLGGQFFKVPRILMRWRQHYMNLNWNWPLRRRLRRRIRNRRDLSATRSVRTRTAALLQRGPAAPQFRSGSHCLASTLISRGRPAGSSGPFGGAVRIEPQNEVAHFRLARCTRHWATHRTIRRKMAFLSEAPFCWK